MNMKDKSSKLVTKSDLKAFAKKDKKEDEAMIKKSMKNAKKGKK